MKKYMITLVLILGLCPIGISAMSNDDYFQVKRDQRSVYYHTIKSAISALDLMQPWPLQANNGDQNRYPDLRGNFGKTLNHFNSGYINPPAYNSLLKALQSGDNADFAAIQLGGARKLVNPQASLAYSLSGVDGWKNAISPAPEFASAETAGEMVEVYWTALSRDVAFNDFGTDLTVAAAVTDLNTMSDFQGPKVGGVVTTGTFLRGNTPGDLIGPYISQFLYQDIPYGTATIAPAQRVPTAGTANDFNSTFADWFTTINGGDTGNSTTFDGTARFIRTPRDLAEFVHADFPGQEGINAALLLITYGANALDPANPYVNNPTQEGFVTFNVGQVLDLVRKATQEGLKAAWYHKWQVNRRLRPEEYGFYVQQQVVSGTPLGINNELINSNALTQIFGTFGTYYLPVAYPEGSPAHPAYPAGHATFIGATVTILKAFFNENFVFASPLQPNAGNTALEAYAGPNLTVGNELNKLAANISLGRDHAGVHYRSDGWDGLLLGEQVAIDILNNESFLFNENFTGFTLTKFDGTTITVGQKRKP